MNPDFLLHLVTVIMGAGAVYVAIRVDLSLAKARADQACADASDAHKRLDAHIDFHVSGDRRHA